LKKCHRRDLNLRPTDPEADTLNTEPPRPTRVASDCIVTCTVRTTVADAQSGQALQLEIAAYLGPVAVSDEEKLLPLMFWKRNEKVYPHLSLLA